jgi:hypothetical protein
MSLLADAINYPIAAAWGLAILGPLNLLVSLIESGVLRGVLGLPMRRTYLRVFLANAVSTLVGALISIFDVAVFELTGILESIPDFVQGYIWAALILIGIYLAKSVVVEGLIVGSKKFAAATGRKRASLFKGVMLGNVVSYCVVGPLYYFATRPTFGGAHVTTDTQWTANPDIPVYFIDPEDQFVKRIRANGSGKTTVVPYPVAAFSMSGDCTAFTYRGTDGNLYVYRAGDDTTIRVWTTTEPFTMQSVSLSPDQQRVAFATGGALWNKRYSLSLFDLRTNITMAVAKNRDQAYPFTPVVTWAKDGQRILVSEDATTIAIFRDAVPWRLETTLEDELPAEGELAEGFVRSGLEFRGVDWRVLWFGDTHGDYSVRCWRGLYGFMEAQHAGASIWRVEGGYGLLKLGLSSPASPTFLPKGVEILVEWWGQLYLLDIENRRLGLLTDGHGYVLPTSRFRPQLSLTDSP